MVSFRSLLLSGSFLIGSPWTLRRSFEKVQGCTEVCMRYEATSNHFLMILGFTISPFEWLKWKPFKNLRGPSFKKTIDLYRVLCNKCFEAFNVTLDLIDEEKCWMLWTRITRLKNRRTFSSCFLIHIRLWTQIQWTNYRLL